MRKTVIAILVTLAIPITLAIIMIFKSSESSLEHIRIDSEKRFSSWTAEKEFEIERQYLRWILPIEDGYLGQQVLETGEKEYKFFVLNPLGKEIRHAVIPRGQGPEEIMGIISETIMLSQDGQSVSFYDGGYYVKSLELESFRVRSLGKIDNIISHYGSRYYIGRHGTSSFETNHDLVVTSFESTGFFRDHVYNLVRYREVFNDFQVIASLKKRLPGWMKESSGDNRRRIIDVDYYARLRYARLFSVDWKREMIYVIPDIETPEIERVEFGGRKTTLRLDINPKAFPISHGALDSYFSWYSDNLDPMLKSTLEYERHRPSHAPALQGIKVIEDRLLIITGNREWDRSENEVLVFGLPSLEYQGSFHIPFPSPPVLQLRWGEGYFSVYDIVEHEEDYLSRHQVYRYQMQ